MRKEKEFRNFLTNIRKTRISLESVDSYVSYCNKIEDVYCCDMEDLIKNPSIRFDVKANASLDDHHVSALNRYLEFAATSASINSITPIKAPRKGRSNKSKTLLTPDLGYDSSYNRVYYAEGIPADERVPGLCKILDDTYSEIKEFAKSILGELLKFPEIYDVPVILSDELPTETYTETDKKIAEDLYSAIYKQERHLEVQDIEDILKNKTFTTRIWGRFFYNNTEPHIKLYYKNTNKTDMDEYIALMKSVLAHEYLHYLEYIYLFSLKKPFRDSRVSEGLADFFGTLFSIRLGGYYDMVVAEDRYFAWKKHFGGVWPYANALYFYILDGNEINFSSNFNYYETTGSIEKFFTVFKLLSPVYKSSALKHMILG